MQQKWVGPYTVVASLGKGLYRIKSQSTDRILKKAVHSARLKEYITSNDTDSSKQFSVSTTQTPANIRFLQLELSLLNFYLHLQLPPPGPASPTQPPPPGPAPPSQLPPPGPAPPTQLPPPGPASPTQPPLPGPAPPSQLPPPGPTLPSQLSQPPPPGPAPPSQLPTPGPAPPTQLPPPGPASPPQLSPPRSPFPSQWPFIDVSICPSLSPAAGSVSYAHPPAAGCISPSSVNLVKSTMSDMAVPNGPRNEKVSIPASLVLSGNTAGLSTVTELTSIYALSCYLSSSTC